MALTEDLSQPIILPLNVDGTLCALKDERGVIIGTGTREVCEVLVQLMNCGAAQVARESKRRATVRSNVRSAIVI